MSVPVLVFERPSVLQLLGVWGAARRAARVYVLDPAFAADRLLGGRLGPRGLLVRLGLSNPDRSLRRFRRVLAWINRRAELRETPMEALAVHFYRLNQAGPAQVDALGPAIVEGPLAGALSRLVGPDPALGRYLKAFLAMAEPRWRIFAYVARDLVAAHAGSVVVPEAPLDERWDDPALGDLRRSVPRGVERLNRVRYAGRMLLARLTLLLVPVALVLAHARHGVRRRPDGPYDVVMPVAWGVYREGEAPVRAGVKRFIDDTYLYGDGLPPGRIVHLFGDWVLAPGNEETFRAAMDERGLPYADRRRFAVTLPLLRLAARAELRSIVLALRPLGRDRVALMLLAALAKAVYHHLRAELEMGNLDYRVAFVRHDYNPGHIIHTIVAHRHGRRVAGSAHAAALCEAPQLAWVHLDKYFAQCELYSRTYGAYWDDVALERSGRESLDPLLTRSEEDVGATRARVRELYGDRRYVVLIMFPSTTTRACLASQWHQMHEGLRRLGALDLDAHIFLRFRRTAFLDHLYGRPIVEIARTDPRMILDHTNFSTLELQSMSDLVVAANASFGINEAVLAGKRVFTFGYTGKEHFYFPPEVYGRDLVLSTADDLVRVVAAVATGFDGVDCRWDLLRRDADYHADGRNCDRIRQGVLELCRSVGPGRVPVATA